MLKVETYSIKGIKASPTVLPKDLAAEGELNLALLAQAVRVYEAKAHVGLAKTKTRAGVNRTKHKLYSQKGTGGARHGAKSAPIFVGGGVAHGPQPVKRQFVLPQKLRQSALRVALAFKAKREEIVLVSGLSDVKKTKEVQSLVAKLSEGKKEPRFTFVLKDKESEAKKALRNLARSRVDFFPHLNAYTVLFGGMLVFDKTIFDKSEMRQAKSGKQSLPLRSKQSLPLRSKKEKKGIKKG